MPTPLRYDAAFAFAIRHDAAAAPSDAMLICRLMLLMPTLRCRFYAFAIIFHALFSH